MRIAIDHRTTYGYAEPASYGVQELRLTPLSSRCQRVVEWHVEAPGADTGVRYVDANGNPVLLINQCVPRSDLVIRVSGVVETFANDGVLGDLANEPRERIFIRQTELTRPGRRLERLAANFVDFDGTDVALCHSVMAAIRDAMTFDVGRTDALTGAEEALAAGHGVCQDFAHVFISVCRQLDRPARYVTGYLLMDEEGEEADAHHAWAETLLDGLGWVGFDPANGISPDDRYVRLACGPDADYAAPVRGIRRGSGAETLEVAVSATPGADQ